MRGFVLVILLHSASAVIHSLKYFSMGQSGPNLPEFMSICELDGVQMLYYDSNSRRAQPTQDWMDKVTEDNPAYLERETEGLQGAQRITKASLENVRQRFNQTGGVHVLQKMFGCEWNDQTGEMDGFMQHAYDGEDFIAFDLETQTWVATKQQALITKRKWDRDPAWTADVHYFLTQICPEIMKTYLDYGRSSLLRTELPSVFLLQRSPCSPISCMATGFFPNRARLFWRKDGEDLHEGVDMGDILPNHDGSFQMRAYLNVSSDEDWQRYECVFQLSGLQLDMVVRLDKAAVRSNPATSMRIPILAILGVLALLSLVTEGVFVLLRRQNRGKLCGHLDFGCSSLKKAPDHEKLIDACRQNPAAPLRAPAVCGAPPPAAAATAASVPPQAE